MSSGYYMELDETAKARYDEKLSCNGNKLPDPFDQSTMEHVFVYNKKLWSPITFGDIYMYLVEKECTYTREKMRNHKSLDAFNYVLSGKIVRVHYFVRGGFVGHRSRASSKHLSPHLPVGSLDSSGVKQGLRCT
ncbi:hypothetical protein TNCV_4451631 [Trichonephila clavipes]|nr:hypothetical protein TNCV_4451631 [Trichonephila clavipes]